MVYVVRIEVDNETDYKELEQDLYNNDKIVDVDLLEVYKD